MGRRATRGSGAAGPAQSQKNQSEVCGGKCIGCDDECSTLVALPRDTNPKDIFPNFVKDKSKACISCAFHAIQVRQVRDALSYKLDVYHPQKQVCLVCNATSGLTPLLSVEGAREAVSHAIVNAHNIEKYLKAPCSLCTCCAYPLQWLYFNVINPVAKTVERKQELKPVEKKQETKPVAKPKAVEKVAAKPLAKSSPKVEAKNPAAVASPSTRATRGFKKPEEKPPVVEETPKKSVRSKQIPIKKDEKKSKEKVALSESEEEALVRSTRRLGIKESPKDKAEAKRTPPRPASKRVAQTKPKPAQVVDKAVKVEPALRGRPKRHLEPAPEALPAKRVRTEQPKPARRPEPAKRPARAARPTLSPPPPKSNARRERVELQERVCETCQQVFYSGTELALHELRHTGRVFRLSLDRYEIPEPVQQLQRSFLFQQPVILDRPDEAVEVAAEPPAFEFQAPVVLEQLPELQDETPKLDVVQEILQEEAEALEPSEDSVPKADEDSQEATHALVDDIVSSLSDEPVQSATESTPVKAPQSITSFSNDFFPPASTKAVESPSEDFFGPSDPPGLKTPPPSTLACLSFDYFGPEASPAKDCSMFSMPAVDPSTALKANSDNPPLPLPSDSDNSLTLTPPKPRHMDASTREAVAEGQ